MISPEIRWLAVTDDIEAGYWLFSDFYDSSFRKQNFFNNSIVLFYKEKSLSLIIYLYGVCLFFRASEKC